MSIDAGVRKKEFYCLI